MQLSNSPPPLSPPPPPVMFEDCQRGREVGFVTNDPNFGVRHDGTVYTVQDVSNLSEPVQFMVTAKGLHDPRVWETTVKLALAGHPHPLALSKVTAPNTTDVHPLQMLLSSVYVYTLGGAHLFWQQGQTCSVFPNSRRGSTDLFRTSHFPDMRRLNITGCFMIKASWRFHLVSIQNITDT